MPERIYAKDPVPVRDHRKLYAVIFSGIALFLILQIGVKLFPGREKTAGEENLVEDKARTLFREEDIARGLDLFGKGAREAALKRLGERDAGETSQAAQGQKERLSPVAILTHAKKEAQAPPEAPKTQEPLGVPLGTQALALLKTKIFSFNVENHVEAETVKDVHYLGKLRIPKGTKFFGTVSVLHSENRVNVRFHRLLLPWGEERPCQAVAHALDGSGGIKGKADRRWLGRTFSILGKTALSALTLFTVPNRQSAFSLDDQLRLTAASNLAQEGYRELDTLKVDKSITVPGGIMIKIIFLESL